MFNVAGRHTFFLPVDTAFDVSRIEIKRGFDWKDIFIWYLPSIIQGNYTG